MKRISVIFLLLNLLAFMAKGASIDEIRRLIDDGHWQKAGQEIDLQLAEPRIEFRAREALLFEKDRMVRIRQDFQKTREEVFQEARVIVPDLTEEMFNRWEKAGGVEYLDIEGKRWFFQRAAGNLFRIHPEARALKAAKGVRTSRPYRLEDVRRVLAAYDQTGHSLNTPKKARITYSLTVKPETVPAGEVIRAWLPFPHSGARQENIRLISTEPPRSIQPGNTGSLASIYLEKAAVEKEPTQFKVCFEYTTSGFYQPIDPARVQSGPAEIADTGGFLGEEPPHLVFNEDVRKLSREITGNETNSWLKARMLFQWVSENIPWAGAREYSTLDCLPRYALNCRHGDCGIQTMLFMTLCRLNGIPARWESGWTTGPDKNMHDWCEIQIKPYGWIPADVSYGMVESNVEREKWFYLGSIDCHRLVLNTDHSQPLYPAKTFFRSEIVDFQRGEVEWRGGNLYFNQWNWNFQVEEIPIKEASASP